jgi:hypothetical protein
MNVELLLEVLLNLLVAGGAAYLYFDNARQKLRYLRSWLTTRA